MNDQHPYALYALERVKKIRTYRFRSPMFLALCILATVIAAFSAVSFLITIASTAIVGTGFSILAEIIGIDLFSAISNLLWLAILLTAISTAAWIFGAVGVWQLYCAKSEQEYRYGFFHFKILLLYIMFSGIFSAACFIYFAASTVIYEYNMERPDFSVLMMLTLLCVGAALLCVLLQSRPFYKLNQYVTSLQMTFNTGMKPYCQLPFVGCLIYGIYLGIMALSSLFLLGKAINLLELFATITDPVFFILLPFFFKGMNDEIESI